MFSPRYWTFFAIVVAAIVYSMIRFSDKPDIIVSPSDTYSYRALTLDNGMKVLLVNTPESDKAAAAVTVNAGSGDDPQGREGLAHFLETHAVPWAPNLIRSRVNIRAISAATVAAITPLPRTARPLISLRSTTAPCPVHWTALRLSLFHRLLTKPMSARKKCRSRRIQRQAERRFPPHLFGRKNGHEPGPPVFAFCHR